MRQPIDIIARYHLASFFTCAPLYAGADGHLLRAATIGRLPPSFTISHSLMLICARRQKAVFGDDVDAT